MMLHNKNTEFVVQWGKLREYGQWLEFTNRFTSEKGKPTHFEKYLAHYGIRHKLIKPYTPRHNGKVERSHRKDNKYFYASHKFYSLKDFAVQLAVHNRRYNNFPMRPLGWKSPREVMNAALDSCVTDD